MLAGKAEHIRKLHKRRSGWKNERLQPNHANAFLQLPLGGAQPLIRTVFNPLEGDARGCHLSAIVVIWHRDSIPITPLVAGGPVYAIPGCFDGYHSAP